MKFESLLLNWVAEEGVFTVLTRSMIAFLICWVGQWLKFESHNQFSIAYLHIKWGNSASVSSHPSIKAVYFAAHVLQPCF